LSTPLKGDSWPTRITYDAPGIIYKMPSIVVKEKEMTLLFYTLAFVVIGLMLLAIAHKPAMLQAMQPTLSDMVTSLSSRRAKHAYRGFYLLFRALAKLFLLLLSGVLVVLASEESEEIPNDSDDDFRYKHEGETYYTHSSGDSSNNWY
jgi:hypothetical protein